MIYGLTYTISAAKDQLYKVVLEDNKLEKKLALLHKHKRTVETLPGAAFLRVLKIKRKPGYYSLRHTGRGVPQESALGPFYIQCLLY